MYKSGICFVLPTTYPLFNTSIKEIFGGAEIELYNLSKRLAKDNDYLVNFIVGDYGQAYNETYDGVNVRKIKYFNHKKYTSTVQKVKRLYYIYKEILFSKEDVFITSTASELLGWMALILTWVRKKKLIFHLASDVNTELSYYKKLGLKFYLLYRFGIFNSSALVSQTKKQQNQLKEKLNLDSIVIANGFFLDNPIAVEDKNTILWVSRAVEMKRPQLFLEMAKRLPLHNFIMIMPGENEVKESIRKLSLELSNVTLIDSVPFSEIQDYYNKAMLFVNTSEFEGFPNSFIQSFMGRTPVLSFLVDPDDIIKDYSLGMVCNDDLDKAVSFVKDLDTKSIEAFGENCNQYVKKFHDIEDVATQYRTLINKLLYADIVSKMFAGKDNDEC